MRLSTLERAFQLAQNGPAATIDEIRRRLNAEGYCDGNAQTSFPVIRKQLRAAIKNRAGSQTPLRRPIERALPSLS